MVTFFRRRDRRYIKSASVKPRPRFRPLLEALEIRINPNTTYIVPPPVVENGVLTNGSSTVSGLGTTTGLFVGEGVTAAGQNFNGTLNNGSTSVTNVGTTNLFVGEGLTGTGIQSGTTIAAFNSATKTITLSQAAVATGQEQLTPSGIPAGTTIASINTATKSVTLSNAAVATGQQSITFADSNPLASTPFNESEALAGVTLIASNANAGGVTTLEAYYADEHALSGIANPLPGVPGHVSNPTLVSGTDASGRPVAPVLYITDMSIASNVLSDGTGIGDWENGGTPVGPNDVFGTWKGPATASDPATNPNWNLGPGSDAPPSTFVSDNYGAEIRWNLNTLIDPATGKPLVAGDSYRFMVIDHDGDQNKTGGDTGFAIFVMPGLITTASPAVTLGTTAPTLSDSAVLSGGTSPTGTLTFKLFSPSHTLVYTDVVSVNGNGTYNTNSSGTPAGGNTLPKTGTVTGTYTWQVSYSGDANNAPATDQGGAQEQTVVSAANPTLVTMAGPTVTVGDGNKLTDTADLEGGYFPTGSITFTLYDSNNNVVDTETVTGINGDGKYTSPGFVPTTAGQYHWAATYNGDNNNNTAIDPGTSAAEGEAVISPNLVITKTGDPSPVSSTDTVHFTITVSNPGPGAAFNVNLSDPLPDDSQVSGGHLNWVIQSGDPGSISGGTLTDAIGTLASGASVVIHLSAATPSGYAATLNNTATATSSNNSTVQASATDIVKAPSLTVVKTPDATSVNSTDAVGFTITVSNAAGAGTAYGVMLNDPLPAPTGVSWTSATLVSGNAPPTLSNNTLSDNIGNLAAGATVVFHVGGTTAAGFSGTLNNTATATPTNGPPASGSGSETVLAPNLVITKTGNGTVNSTDTVKFTITVSNTGAGTAENVNLSDPLPDSAHLVWTITSGPGSISGGTLTDAIGNLASGASVTINVAAVTPSGYAATLNNTATATAANNSPGSVQASATDIVKAPSLTVVKTPDATSVNSTDAVGFTITVSNAAGAGTAYGVMLNDPLPALTGLTWTTATLVSESSGVIAQNPPTLSGNNLSDDIGNMAAGATVVFHVGGTTAAGFSGTLNNTATATPTNGPPGSGTGTETVLAPSLSVVKTPDSANPLNSTDAVGFTITVSNTAGAGTAYGVVLSDALPALTGLSWTTATLVSESSGVNAQNPPTLSGNNLRDNIGNLAAGATVTFHVVGTTVAGFSGTLNNTATATPANGSPASGSASETVLAPNLSVTKTADASTVDSPSALGFTITVSNSSAAGTGTAYNVNLSDPLPVIAGVTWTSATLVSESSGVNAQNPPTLSGNNLSDIIGSLAAGATVVFHVGGNAAAGSGGFLNNTATVTSSNNVPGTLHASASIHVIAGPSLVTTASPAVTLGNATTTISDKIVMSNLAPAPDTGTINVALKLGSTTVYTTSFAAANTTYTASYTLPTSGTVTGTYTWSASYAGDSNNQSATDEGGAQEQTVVSKAQPTVVTTASPAITLGTTAPTVSDSAVLSGAYFPTGSIVFTLSGPGGFSYSQTDTVTSNGTYTASTTLPTTGTVAGTYTWSVTYQGDANNLTAHDQGGTQEQTVVSKAQPTVVTAVSNPSVTLGATTTISDTATLSGAYFPAGTITFTLSYEPTGSTTFTPVSGFSVTDTVTANGSYSASFTLPTTGNVAGTYLWHAVYNGDGNNLTASDNGTNEKTLVNQAPTTLTTLICPSPGVVVNTNTAMKDSATLTGAFDATGTITFKLFAPGVNVSTGTPVYTTVVTLTGEAGTVTVDTGMGNNPVDGYVPTVVGTYNWVASYSGDTDNAKSVSPTEADVGIAQAPTPPYPLTTTGATPLQKVAFNESSTLAGFRFDPTTGTVQVYYTDEHAMLLGVSAVTVDQNGTIKSGSNVVTVNTASLLVGDTVAGTGIATGTTITSIGSGSITLSANATASATEILAFTTAASNPNYKVSPLPSDPGSVTNPSLGAPYYTPAQLGLNAATVTPLQLALDQAADAPAGSGPGATDPSGRPNSPVGFVTDITGLGAPATGADDWQNGGAAQGPNAVFGTWKTATETINLAKSTVTLSLAADPSKNTTLGPGADPLPSGISNQGYLAEARWNLSSLEVINPATGVATPLIEGHTYRFYVIVHDGDQNQSGGDSGQAAFDFTVPCTDELTAAGTPAAQALAANPPGFGRVAPGVYTVSVDGLTGPTAPAEQARISDAIANLNATLAPFGATLVEVASDSANAAIHLRVADTTSVGGATQGVLGAYEYGSTITLVNGWNWYTGSDPTQIGSNQYDFQTIVEHELGHAVGIDESSDPTSVMYGILAPGQVRRDLSASDLSLIQQGLDGRQASTFSINASTTDGQETPLSSLSGAGMESISGPVVGARSAQTQASLAADLQDVAINASSSDDAFSNLSQAGSAGSVLVAGPNVLLNVGGNETTSQVSSLIANPTTLDPRSLAFMVSPPAQTLLAPGTLLTDGKDSSLNSMWEPFFRMDDTDVLPFELPNTAPVLPESALTDAVLQSFADDLGPNDVSEPLFRMDDKEVLPFVLPNAVPALPESALTDAVLQAFADDLGRISVPGARMAMARPEDTDSPSDHATLPSALACIALLGGLSGMELHERSRRLLEREDDRKQGLRY